MKTVELAAGTIEYDDIGQGRPIVLLAGLLMDSTLWAQTAAALSSDYRCIIPTLPLGAHRLPMRPEADLSLAGVAAMVSQMLDRLGLSEVALVGNDSGGAVVQLVLDHDPTRISRVVLISCEAFDNYPAHVAGTALAMTGRLPAPAFGLAMQQLRLRPLRRLPISFGWLTKRGDVVVARALRPLLNQAAIRHDLLRTLRAERADRTRLAQATRALSQYRHPALVAWAAEDRVMPLEHGRRLATTLPSARFVSIADTYTLVPLDQPAQLADIIHTFLDTSHHA